MVTVGMYEAKTHFSELIDRVSKGERVEVTRHGVPVAVISSPSDAERVDVHEVLARLREFRKGRTLGDTTFRELIEEGRRY